MLKVFACRAQCGASFADLRMALQWNGCGRGGLGSRCRSRFRCAIGSSRGQCHGCHPDRGGEQAYEFSVANNWSTLLGAQLLPEETSSVLPTVQVGAFGSRLFDVFDHLWQEALGDRERGRTRRVAGTRIAVRLANTEIERPVIVGILRGFEEIVQQVNGPVEIPSVGFSDIKMHLARKLRT